MNPKFPSMVKKGANNEFGPIFASLAHSLNHLSFIKKYPYLFNPESQFVFKNQIP